MDLPKPPVTPQRDQDAVNEQQLLIPNKGEQKENERESRHEQKKDKSGKIYWTIGKKGIKVRQAGEK
jgi:hypothetical protein